MYTMNPVDLPPQRAAVLAFLRRELAAGRAPSLADIAGAFGFASRNAAQKHVQALVADVVTVSDEALKRALRFFAGRMKIVVEPTGCLGAAAAFEQAIDVRGRRVGVILSGGNVDLARYAALLTG